MSLDWNTRECPSNGVTSGWIECEGNKGEEPGKRIHPDTNSLVWGTFCGFHVGGMFKPQNIDEIIWRIAYLKKVNRPWMSDGTFPSVEAVQNHVFMSTNSDTKTRKQWLAFVTSCLSDEVTRSLRRDLEAGEESGNSGLSVLE